MDEAEKRELYIRIHEEALNEPMDYFPHDSNAFEDDKLFAVFEQWGHAGIGLFWILAGLLHKKVGHVYDVSNGYGRLAHDMYTDEDTCERFMATLDEVGLTVEGLLRERGKVSLQRAEKNAREYADKVAPARLGAAITNAKRRA